MAHSKGLTLHIQPCKLHKVETLWYFILQFWFPGYKKWWYICIYHEYFMLLIGGSFSKLHQSFISSKHASHNLQINRCRVKLLPIDFIGIRAHVDPILVKPTIEGFIKLKDLGKILFIIIFYMTCNGRIPTKYHKEKKGKRKEGMHFKKWNTHRN